MGGNPEQFASRGDERQQQSRVATGGVRVEGPVDQSRTGSRAITARSPLVPSWALVLVAVIAAPPYRRRPARTTGW